MCIEDYNYLWTTEKDSWVLVNTEYGYAIVNKKDQKALLVSNEELADALVEKMLKAGNQTYENINDAYADSGRPDAKNS